MLAFKSHLTRWIRRCRIRYHIQHIRSQGLIQVKDVAANKSFIASALDIYDNKKLFNRFSPDDAEYIREVAEFEQQVE